jgi:hypothetical protein
MGTKRKPALSTKPKPDRVASNNNDKYAFMNSGPAVSEGGEKIAGRALNNAQTLLSLATAVGPRPTVATTLPTKPHQNNDSLISDITSVAGQFNSYRFDETSILKTYKKLMTLYLKDEMFSKLKFITSDAMLEFSREDNSICGYLCKRMRVATYQWGKYWELVKKSTKKMIENQRTNATTATLGTKIDQIGNPFGQIPIWSSL